MNVVFWIFLFILIGWTFFEKSERQRSLSRDNGEWIIDLANLGIHLWLLPIFQAMVLFRILDVVTPEIKNTWSVGPLGSLGLYIGLDYLWYWNHRLLHSYTWVWNLHAVHHSAKQVDVFTSARNSIWSHVFEVYIWFIAGVVYLVSDPGWFLFFVVMGSMSNFWSHTTLTFSRHSIWYRWISKILITPHEHLWHHSTSHSNTNFGTVFSIWDRMHGTHYAPAELPDRYGNDYIKSPFLQLMLPVPALERARKTTSEI